MESVPDQSPMVDMRVSAHDITFGCRRGGAVGDYFVPIFRVLLILSFAYLKGQCFMRKHINLYT